MDALERSVAERSAFVESACDGDDSLRMRVEALLRAEGEAGPFLSSPTVGGREQKTSEERTGTRIGRFTLMQKIGDGGFGTVWTAEQEEPVRREVALKLLKPGMDTRAVVARFEQERQALALMEHPNIAAVFDGGETPSGRPYFAMELVRGEPIREFCDRQQVDTRSRLRLFLQVCHAVQHAHQKGVIHRDLKPANVLVSMHDGVPVPKVIDFGVAKAMHRPLTDKTLLTDVQQMIGTPEYMSPEQTGPSAADIDTRTDIYSLGVLLYELLTGVLPLDSKDLKRKTFLELVRAIREDEPPRPSTRIGTMGPHAAEVARRHGTGVRRLLRLLSGDLDWIVMKALEKERDRRYVSADALAADIDCYLRDEPVLAGPPSRAYRIRKYVRRHRVGVTAAALVTGALVIGASAALWQANRAGNNARQLAAKVNEFDALAGVVMYERAIEAERGLYPAWPSRIENMERWLREDCGRLLIMQPEIERIVSQLRSQPIATDADADRRRRQHPSFAEWQSLGKRVAELRRAAAVREGRVELAIPALTADLEAKDARGLNELAWDHVAPLTEDRRVFGEEALGLACAEAALKKSTAGDHSEREEIVLNTLAWALFANGKDDEAKRRSAEALAAAPKQDREFYEGLDKRLARAIATSADSLAAAEKQYDALTVRIASARPFQQQFLFESLVDLLSKLERLRGVEKPAVERRLEWARRIGELSLHHPNARVTWAEARERIAKADGVVASTRYRGQPIELRDEDVVGLVPIGMNPVTKLWEFYDLRSAWDGTSDPAAIEIPRHDPKDGSIEVTGATGIIFVLLPGGTFTMGAQSTSPDQPNFDPNAREEETPHEVVLAPFFLARHELTRAQWRRLMTGVAPFYFEDEASIDLDPLPIGPTHPAESIDWNDANRCMEMHGLTLPTEAQWEYGCRAGTTTPWWTGAEAQSLEGAANILDRTGGAREPMFGTPDAIDDGFTVVSPVGTFRANAFGLFDVHGNVWEWCLDRAGSYSMPERPGDGLRRMSDASQRMLRGGGYQVGGVKSRSAQRILGPPSLRYGYLGLRAARACRIE